MLVGITGILFLAVLYHLIPLSLYKLFLFIVVMVNIAAFLLWLNMGPNK